MSERTGGNWGSVANLANQARGAAYYSARTRILNACESTLQSMSGDHCIGGLAFLMADTILAGANEGREADLLALVHAIIDYRFKMRMENRQ